MRIFDFDECTERMIQQRTLLDVAFYPRFAYQGHWVVMTGQSRGSSHIQRTDHIDTIVQINDQGRTLTIDEKIDSQNRSTIFAEIISVKERDKSGWMVPGVSQADALLWAFSMKRPLGLKVYVFWLEPLITWFWHNEEMFIKHEVRSKRGGTYWTTIGRSIPIRMIPEHCYLADKEIITSQLSFF